MFLGYFYFIKLKNLELDIQCDTDWLNPDISEDEYIER